ncbi:MAG TPA: hypothetical protein VN442_21715 [Bryobacteraceae bacterium]|nr:hypothetical protein [Bryobacteraceae bacterium]
MTRFAAVLLLAPALAAQLTTDVFQKAPPAVEEALRARIKEFYQLHVDGKFRQAEALVAEESKEMFYSMNKPKYVSFEIDRIEWSDEFTKAKVTVVCQRYVMVPGFTGKPLPVPTPSRWKVENGQWVWYIDKDSIGQTPFGKMKAGTVPATGDGKLPALPSEADAIRMVQQVKVDKTAVALKLNAPSSDQVTVTNPLSGPVTVSISNPSIPGLEIQIAEPTIPGGKQATVVFRYRPGKTKPPASVAAAISSTETGQSFPIKIQFGK